MSQQSMDYQQPTLIAKADRGRRQLARRFLIALFTVATSSSALPVLAAPAIAKAFAPASIPVNGTSMVTLTLTNSSATSAAVLTSGFTDALPAGVSYVVATAATSCSGGTVTVAGSNVTLASGATIPAGGSCTVTFNVTSAVANTVAPCYVNSLPIGALQTGLGSNAAAASASLCVTPPPTGSITVSKTVLDGPTPAPDYSGFGVFATCNLPAAGTRYPTTGTVSIGTSAPGVISGIPSAAVCTITESTAALPSAPPGFSWSPAIAYTQPATIVAGGSVAAAVTNRLMAMPLQTCTPQQQRASERWWYFGNRGVIDFATSGTTATASVNPSAINVREGSTVVSDDDGSLLFWAGAPDGSSLNVYNRNQQAMPNGSGITANNSAVQAVVAFPAVDVPGRYFVVSNTGNVSASGTLYYSVVDMALDGGRGDVVVGRKNIQLGVANTTSEAITAVPNADGSGFWVITYTRGSPLMRAYAFDSNGPVTGNAVITTLSTNNYNGWGTLYFNAKLDRLLQLTTLSNNSYLRVLKFNASTGQAVEEFSLPLSYTGLGTGHGAYAADFSPSGDYLYVSRISPARLTRYRLAGATDAASILASVEEIGVTGAGATGTGNYGGHVRRAPDGRMYITNQTGDGANQHGASLNVVNNPDAATAAGVGYMLHGFPLPTTSGSRLGLPQMVTGCPLASDVDYGDAPDSYGTLLASGGASHRINGYDAATHTAALMLGSRIDPEFDGYPSVNADGDDLAVPIDDEDALAGSLLLAPGSSSVSLAVPVTNSSGVAATLYAWIDFNGNGRFDAGELATAPVADAATTANLSWTGITPLPAGFSSYLRLRLTSTVLAAGTAANGGDARSVGPANNGEVEDHRVETTPRLTLVKTVTNDHGGVATPASFTLSATGPTTITGASGSAAVTSALVTAGSYVLSETNLHGYVAGAWSCAGGSLVGSTLTLANSQTAICTIDNNDQAATLTLIKTVTNDNGGTATVSSFPLTATGPTTISGVSGTPAVTAAAVAAGSYALSEVNLPGYIAGAWSCVGGTLAGNNLTLALGQSATCSIVNNDQDGFFPPQPFASCPANVFVARRVGANPSGLYDLDPATGVLTLPGGAINGNSALQDINAIGFRQADGFIYGWKNAAPNQGNIVRVGVNGQGQLLGTVAGLTPTANLYSGDINPGNGHLYLYGNIGHQLFEVDVTTSPPTLLSTTAVAPIPGNLADIAFHPLDGNIYAIDGTTREVVRIAPSTGALTGLGYVLPNAGTGDFGGIWFDAEGTLHGFRTSGHVFRVFNVDGSGPLAGSLLYQAPALTGSGIDSASCPGALPTAAPLLQLSKITQGGFGGPFTFTLGNTTQAGGSVSTIAANSAMVVDGDVATPGTQAFTIATIAADVVISEASLPANWLLSDFRCIRDGATVGGRVGNTYTIPGGEVLAGRLFDCTVTNALTPANVTLVKALTSESGSQTGIAEPGETLTYTITLANSGGSAFANYDFVENVPVGATLTSISGIGVTGACTLPLAGAGSCNVTVASVPGNASTTVNVVFTVDNPVASAIIQIANTVSAGDTTCNVAGNTCSVTTPVVRPPMQTCTVEQARASERWWYFGNRGLIDFGLGGNTATAQLNPQPRSSVEGSTVVTDSDGQLLFWAGGSSGLNLYNRNQMPMLNATGLLGNESAVQMVAAFPALNTPGKYFVVTTGGGASGSGNGPLRYSVVDMALDGGLGGVVVAEKNITLGAAGTASEALTAVPNADGSGFWVLTYTFNSPNLLAYEFKDAGPVTGVPVVTTLSSNNYNGYGSLYFNQQLDQLALLSTAHSVPGRSMARLLRFDAATGHAFEQAAWATPQSETDANLGASGLRTGYAADFSPDGSYLYVSRIYPGRLYRYNVSSGLAATISASEEFVGSTGNGGQGGGHIRRGPDGRMYVARQGDGANSRLITRIESPDAPTVGGNVAASIGFALGNYPLPAGATSSWGLPQMVTGCPLASARDFGDAPDSYGTLLASGGAVHDVAGYVVATNTAPLMLGARIDSEFDGYPSINADGDDLAVPIDDEDAFNAPVVLAPGSTVISLTVPLVNSSGAPATLYAWIDFNGNGRFDANEATTSPVAAGASSVVVSWLGVPALAPGFTGYLRLRLTSSALAAGTAANGGDARAVGAAADGEVEDHRVETAPVLTLVKIVTNDNGGVATVASFPLTATGPTTISGVSGTAAVKSAVVAAGTYTLSEANLPGYVASAWSCVGGNLVGTTVTLANNQSATCTITNDDQAATLTLIKTVTNDNGGVATISDFPLTATGPTSITGVSGTAPVTAAPVSAGTYALSEVNIAGYTAGSWSCTGGTLTGSSVTLASGQIATCTINNNDQAATLTLIKTVTNDNGGVATISSFPLTATGPTTISGVSGTPAVTSVAVTAGSYVLSETNLPGYSAGAWSCTAGALSGTTLVLANGQSATCTINNDDQAATLTLIKTVTNDDGGLATISSFPLTATGPTTITGISGTPAVTAVAVSAGSYALSEVNLAGYVAGAWSCVGGTLTGSSVTLASGQSATCTINNNDVAPNVTLVKALTGESGAQAGIAEPGETLTYTITLANSTATAFAGYDFVENVPAGATLTSVSGAGVSACALPVVGAGTCAISVASVPASGSTTVTVLFTVASPIPVGITQIANTVTGGDTNCTAPGNTCTVITPVASILSVSKVVSAESISSDGVAQPGEQITYTITVRNHGGTPANGVLVNEHVPANTSFVSGTPSWTCSAGAVAGSACNTLVDVPAASGATPGVVTATFTVRVVDPIPLGVMQIANVVALNDQPPVDCSANPTATQCAVLPTINVSLSKTVLAVTPTGPNSYVVKYQIDIANSGGSIASYTLTDTLGFASGVSFIGPATVATTGGTLNPALAGGSYTPANGTVQQLSASPTFLPIGASHRYTVSVPIAVNVGSVSAGACTGAAGNGLFNQANITGSFVLGSAACAPASGDAVRIALAKTVRLQSDANHNGYGDVGDVLGYTFVISNPGTQPLSAIQLIDPRVSDISCAATTGEGTALTILRSDTIAVHPFEGLGDLAAGDTITCTATYTLTAADVANRRVVNVATTTGSGPSGQVATATGTAIFAQFR